jgi:hypothetical protein
MALCSESSLLKTSVLHYIVLGKKDQQHHHHHQKRSLAFYPTLEREKMKSERDPDFSPSVQL